MSINSLRHFLRFAFNLVLLLGSASLFAAGPGNDRMSNWWHGGTSSGVMFAALENQGLWKTTDAGTTWTQVGQSLGGYVNAVYFSAANPQAVCAAKDGVPYYSLDGGTTWQLNSAAVAAVGTGYVNWFSGANGDASLRLAVVNHNKVYQNIVTLEGSTVTNMTVTDISAGLPANIGINAPVRVDSNGNMVLATNQGVFRRIKNAQSWGAVTSTWTAINTGLGSDLNVMEVRPYSGTLVAITQRNAWRLDNGTTWTNVNNNLPAAPGKLWSLSDGSANAGVYITIPGYGIYKTADGSTWTPFQQAVPGETIGNIAIIGTAATGTKVIGVTARGLYVAADANAAWQPASGFTPSNGCSDPTLVATIQTVLDNFSASNFTALGSFVHENFLDDGMANSNLFAHIREDRNSMPTAIAQKVLNPLCRISATGDRALVTNIERSYGRENAETGLMYLMHEDTGSWEMIKQNGEWKVYGNRLPFRLWVNAGVFVNANGTPDTHPWISFGLEDEANPSEFTAVTVSGPGIAGTASLTYNADNKQWQSWVPNGPGANAQFSGTADPTNGGASPLTYTVAVTRRAGDPYSAQVVVKGPFLSQAPKLLPRTTSGVLRGKALMPNSANYSYAFELNDSQGSRVASSYNLPTLDWTFSPPQVPAAGTYALMPSVRVKAGGGVEYMAMSSENVCFNGTQWSPGACQPGGNGTFTHGNYSQAFIGANRDTGGASSGTTTYGFSVAYPRASNDQLVSYTLSCPGYQGVTGNLPSASSGSSWTMPLNFGTTKPNLPIACNSTLTNSSNQTNSKSITIDHFNEAYPLNPAVAPTTNGANLPPELDCTNPANAPVVTWTNPATGSFTYQMSIAAADYSNHQWVGDNLTSPVNLGTVTPNLIAGASYKNLLASTETANGNIYAAQLHLPFSCASGGGGTTTTTTSTSTTTTSTAATTTTTSSTTTTTLAISFVPGWNLVGNGTTSSLDVANAFGNQQNVETVWKWVASARKWAFYAPSLSAQDLAAHAASNGYDVLATIASGEGFWVNVRSAFDIQFPAHGLLASSVYRNDAVTGLGRVLQGWNLLATGDNTIPSEFNKTMSATPPGQGVIPMNLTTLWAWKPDTRQWYLYAPSLHKDGTLDAYATGHGYLGFGSKTLTPTTGFWVNKP